MEVACSWDFVMLLGEILMSFIKELGRALIKLRLAPLVRIKQKDFVLRLYPSSISLLLWVNSWRKKQSYPEDEDFFRG